MSLDPNRYVAVTAGAAPSDPQAAADLEAAAAAGAIAGDIAAQAALAALPQLYLRVDGGNADAGFFQTISYQIPSLAQKNTPVETDLLVIYPLGGPAQVINWGNFLEAIVAQTGGLVDSGGNPFNPDSHPQTFAYDGSGNVSTITATDGVTTWVQTFTYGTDGVATVSNWVVQ